MENQDIIDKALAKYDLKYDRFYDVGKLYEIMQDLGLVDMKTRKSFLRNFIIRKADNGKLVLPSKDAYARWRITGKQIKDIIVAFAPGGEGRYDYREHV